ncbi:MAG TPA: hypothetical protein VFQ25_08540 [Ktedonobacterales bacterium]|nr:hypothetical protein [Ktedonobacterales bacterium]
MKTCPSCGRVVVDPAAAICPNCGTALSAPAPSATPAEPQIEQVSAPAPGGLEYGHLAAPSQPMYPYPGYPPQPAGPSQPMYPYGGYPPQPAPPSQPMYPYGAYPQGPGLPTGAYPPPYMQAPGANWRPGQERRGPSALVIALVIGLVIAVLGGMGYGVYALTAKTGAPAIQVGGTPTATVPANALLNDPLTANTYGWSSSTSHCYFDQDGYHINNDYYCSAPIGAVADGRVTVTVKEISGSTKYPYGISFRLNGPHTHYFFAIVSDSYWALFRDVDGGLVRLSDYKYNAAIHGGLNVKNTLTVEFRGQHITCMVNGVTVGDITDSGSSLGAGRVALEAGQNVSAVFTDFIALP